MTERVHEYFLAGNGILREVIQADLCRYLGNDALVRPGRYEGREGFFIRNYRNLSSEMISDLKEDSRRWANERTHIEQRYPYATAPSYLSSSIHDERQQFGPTLSVPDRSSTAPVVGQFQPPSLPRSYSKPETVHEIGESKAGSEQSVTVLSPSSSRGIQAQAKLDTGSDRNYASKQFVTRAVRDLGYTFLSFGPDAPHVNIGGSPCLATAKIELKFQGKSDTWTAWFFVIDSRSLRHDLLLGDPFLSSNKIVEYNPLYAYMEPPPERSRDQVRHDSAVLQNRQAQRDALLQSQYTASSQPQSAQSHNTTPSTLQSTAPSQQCQPAYMTPSHQTAQCPYCRTPYSWGQKQCSC